MFVKTSRGCVILKGYVDDMVISGSDENRIQQTKDRLKSRLHIKDLGQLHYFLGLEVLRNGQGIYVSQKKYIVEMLQETGTVHAKSAAKTHESGTKLQPNEGEALEDAGKYRRLVGKLIYLTMTRPDISFAVSLVSQFMQHPRVSHWNAVLRILKYLKSCPKKGLFCNKHDLERAMEFEGFVDADWAGSPYDRKSTSGYCIKLGGNHVVWKSKK